MIGGWLAKRTRRQVLVTLVVCAMLVVAAGTWCVFALKDQSAAEDGRTMRSALADQAPRALATVFSVKAARWEADRAAARDLLTTPLGPTLAPALAERPAAGVREVAWKPTSTAIVDVDGVLGSVLSVVEVTVTGDTGAPKRGAKSVFATFTYEGGRWLLSSVEDLQ